MAKVSFLLAAVALMITFQEGLALKCWRCSSDSTNAAFCRDPFDPSILTEQQRRWSYVDCTFPPNQINPYQTTQTRPVCKKMTQKSYDKYIVSRSCYWEDINTPPDTCQRATTPAFIQTEFCETCSTDGCNGASTQALSAFLFLGASALVYQTLKW